MGEYTTFHCDGCGYESRTVRWGVSMVDPRRRYMPAECMTCRELVEVDLTGADLLVDEFGCEQCGAEVFFVEKAQSYSCPKCGAGNLHVQQGPTYW